MSSRDDRRRRDRSRERDKGRDSRDRDRDSYSRRERSRERERQRDYRKDRPPRSRSRSPRREDKDRHSRYDSERHRDAYRDRKDDRRNGDRPRRSEPERSGLNSTSAPKLPHATPDQKSDIADNLQSKPVQLDPDDQGFEEGEEQELMQEIDPETEAMNAMMGFGGFGTTKGKEISGNQEGAVFVKKQRTWRQYMNRRGGFNRPLDKIK